MGTVEKLMLRGPLLVAIVLGALLAATPVPAYAYLDPGTGSYAFQVLAAAVISAGFVLKAYWARVRAWFTRRRRPPTEGDHDQS